MGSKWEAEGPGGAAPGVGGPAGSLTRAPAQGQRQEGSKELLQDKANTQRTLTRGRDEASPKGRRSPWREGQHGVWENEYHRSSENRQGGEPPGA